eukprot:4482932-Amphidinium_carterae.1
MSRTSRSKVEYVVCAWQPAWGDIATDSSAMMLEAVPHTKNLRCMVVDTGRRVDMPGTAHPYLGH